MPDYSLGNRDDQNYIDYLERVRRAQEKIALGYSTLKEDVQNLSLADRFRYHRMQLGLGGYDKDSAFSSAEQSAMARGDMASRVGMRFADMAFGSANLMSSFVPTAGALSSMAGNLGLFAGISGKIAGSAGMMGLGEGFGFLSSMTNPYYLAAIGAIKLGQFGMQEGVIDPFINSRMFQSTSLAGMRGVLGGMQSSLGTGGLSMGESMGIGRSVEAIRRSNRDMSPEQINQFLQASSEMPQMQYVTNVSQAVENISKIMDFMVEIQRKFKNKNPQEIVDAFRQFGQMGMTLEQSKRAFDNTQAYGSLLNIDPSKIMTAGYNTSQMMMGTNISQSMGYNLGSANFIQAERMRQAGQLSATQLQNFGGSEGISQITSGMQMRFLNSNLGSMFLKGIYQMDSGNTAAGIDNLALDKMMKGGMGIGETRYRSSQITLNPEANMQFQFDKDAIISSLGENAQGFVYGSLNQLFSNKNPFGSTLQGRARFLMSMGLADTRQQAMLFAQNWMSYNPALEQLNKERQMDAITAGNDPYFSSGSSMVRGMNYMSRDFGRGWEQNISRGAFGIFNPDTQLGQSFSYGVGGYVADLTGSRGISNWYRNAFNTRTLGDPRVYGKIKDADDFLSILRDSDVKTQALDPGQLALENEGRSLSYAQLENYQFVKDRDKLSQVREALQFGLGTGLSELAKDRTMNGTNFGEFRGRSRNEIISTLRNRFALSDTYTVNGMEVGSDKILEGLYLENTLSPAEKQARQDRLIMGSTVGLKLKDVEQTRLKAGRNMSSLSGIIASTIGGGAGALGVTLIDAITGNSSQIDKYQNFSAKFETADLNTKLKMGAEIEKIVNSGNTDFKVDEKQRNLLGVDGTYNDFKSIYDQNSQLFEKMKTDTGFMKNMAKREKIDDIRRGVKSLYGGTYYKNLSRELTGKDSTIETIMEKFLFGEGKTEGVSMSRDEYSDLIKNLGGQAGIGDMLKRATTYDQSSGKLVFKDISQSTESKIMRNIYQNDGGKFAELQISSAEKLWDSRRGDKASTIQDFATAFAKGLQIYNNGTGDNFSKPWNEVKTSIDNPKK